MELDELIQTLEANRDDAKAPAMRAYMRNQFPFLGIQSKERRKLTRPFLRNLKHSRKIDWEIVEQLYQLEPREYQYVACDYLNNMKHFAYKDDLPELESVITTKSWWDTVDSLDGITNALLKHYPEGRARIIEWSLDDNMWLRRSAIICQRKRKKATDVDLLETTILNNLGQDEFFIDKAIGWALREYSKTNEHWVNAFISHNEQKMAPLSIREASKYL